MNKIILKDGCVKLEGFEYLINGIICFKILPSGIAIMNDDETNRYNYIKIPYQKGIEIKNKNLYDLLKKRKLEDETYFTYIKFQNCYLEQSPHK